MGRADCGGSVLGGGPGLLHRRLGQFGPQSTMLAWQMLCWKVCWMVSFRIGSRIGFRVCSRAATCRLALLQRRTCRDKNAVGGQLRIVNKQDANHQHLSVVIRGVVVAESLGPKEHWSFGTKRSLNCWMRASCLASRRAAGVDAPLHRPLQPALFSTP